MYKILSKYTLLWSFVLGALLAVLLYQDKNYETQKNNLDSIHVDEYEKWFNNLRIKKRKLSMDYIKYGSESNLNLESSFLRDKIQVLCVLLVRKRKNAAAANQTWAKHCNDKIFIYLQPENIQKTKLPIRQVKLESSWHLLCDAIRNMNNDFQWALFLNDDTFALVENVRRMIAGLDHKKGYYLGHAITFWGTEYNIAQAGYILSKGSIDLIRSRFNSTESCAAGGRFWKQEDYYLGKHLANLNVYPIDTRDHQGRTTFHGHSLMQLLYPGAIKSLELTNYYSRSIFPADKCCSPFAITFQTVEADKMYTNYYLLYQLEVFRDGGQYGNKRPHHEVKDEEAIWRNFVAEKRGIEKPFRGEISPEAYFELWKTVVNDPINFNRNIRKWSAPKTSLPEP